MYKLLSLLVLVALAAFVFAEEKQDQEAAEQYFLKYGYYPSWYSYAAKAVYPAAYSYPYAAAAPAYTYPAAYSAYPYSYGYKAAYPYGYNYVY